MKLLNNLLNLILSAIVDGGGLLKKQFENTTKSSSLNYYFFMLRNKLKQLNITLYSFIRYFLSVKLLLNKKK